MTVTLSKEMEFEVWAEAAFAERNAFGPAAECRFAELS